MSVSKNNRRKELSRQNPTGSLGRDDDSAEVVKALLDADPGLKSLGDQKLQQVGVAIMRSEKFSGPLPHPEHLEQYKNLISNGAERIMVLVEKQTEHRIKTEASIVRGTLSQNMAAQIFAFLLAILSMFGGFYLAITDRVFMGSVMLGVPVMTMIAGFLKYGIESRHRN